MQEVDTKTIEMFRLDEVMPTVEELVERATKAIRAILEDEHPIIVAFSGGKDSSVVANIVLITAAQAVKDGLKPFVVFTTGDTLVENPEVTEHYLKELKRIREYGQNNGFEVVAKVVTPGMSSTFQMKILSGRGIPSYPGGNGDCSMDLKVTPQRQFRKKLFKSLSKRSFKEPVTCIGTRFSESERRAAHMMARGERDDKPQRNKDGELVLSPIARWSTEDVWEYIGMVTSGIWEGFSDFAEMMRIYSHSAGTSCAVVADAIHEGGEKKRKGGCGTRTGCWSCQMSEDKSLEALIEFDERYAYAKGLNKLNKYIRAIRYDWSRRHWVGRTIREGYISIQPDTFHPKEIRNLTRMMMQLDYDEQKRARMAGERPKFCLIPLEMLIALDAVQSLNGIARPFQMWADRRDIWDRGIRYDVPEIEPYKKVDLPDARFLHVGKEWDDTADRWGLTGLRNVYVEALTEGSGCAPELKTLPNGRAVWKAQTDLSFTVDTESAVMISEFEVDRLLEMHDLGFHPGGITEGYMWYLSYGTLVLSHSQQSEHDEIARRTAYKDRLGLTLDYSIDDLLKQSIGFTDLPPDARKAWGHKATTESSQSNFLEELDLSVQELMFA